MKIAIQGHPTRGKEIIKILESLGGVNTYSLSGACLTSFYYINKNNNIKDAGKSLCNYTLYTLEEFEKEFPYKIGETVITTLNHVGTIIGIVNSKYKVLFKEDSALVAPRRLKPYTKMKEGRNITLTLDKAKEWYNKGGELREVALQAFTKAELNPLPRSWEEYCRKYETCCLSTRYTNIPLKYDALIKLEQLRDCWRQSWEPIWDCSEKWCIRIWGNELSIGITTNISRFLTFPTKEMAKEFLECFRDLIEKAGDLI